MESKTPFCCKEKALGLIMANKCRLRRGADKMNLQNNASDNVKSIHQQAIMPKHGTFHAKWGPYSAHAYGANAVYIPNPAAPGAVEFVLTLTQTSPHFKTHPALDIWHGYICGPERFSGIWDMRVLSWQALPEDNYWSFLYLPENSADCRLLAEFISVDDGCLELRVQMINNTSCEREWVLTLYAAPTQTEELPRLCNPQVTADSAEFGLCGLQWRIDSGQLIPRSIDKVIDGHGFPNFRPNVEISSTSDNPLSNMKQRLRIRFLPVTLCAHDSDAATIIIDPLGRAHPPAQHVWPSPALPPEDDLPYKHAWWEMQSMLSYSKSFRGDRMALHTIPAHQWGKFFMWDAGMALIGAVEESPGFVDDQLSEMPDPEVQGEGVFSSGGSPIPTCIFAWWELYCKTGDKHLLKRHYHHMAALFLACYSWPKLMPDKGHDGLVRSPGNSNGIDDYPPKVYCSGWEYSWDYAEMLPLNSDRQFRLAAQPGLTAFSIRFAKILCLAAYVLGQTEEIKRWKVLIDRSQAALNNLLWSDELGQYVWRTDEDGLIPMPGLDGCYPLLSGSVSDDRYRRVLEHVLNPEEMWTKYGVTMVPRNSSLYRAKGYWNGAIWIPPQWFIWKAFYNIGRMQSARMLSDRVMRLWERNHAESLCCWEKFQIKTGKGAGNSRFAGLSMPVLSLKAARRTPGRVQFGQDVVADVNMAEDSAQFSASLCSPFEDVTTGISAVLRPMTKYRIECDGLPALLRKSDNYGYLGFNISLIAGTQTKLSVCPHNT